MPKVSVVIPFYNGKEFIAQAINGILRQTYTDYEIIVMDDGSSDDSKKALECFDGKIRYFYQQNKGISSARNRAIKEAKGEYIALLDQDDIWYPEKLQKQVELMEKNKNLGLIYGDCHYINEKGEIISRVFERQKYYSGRIFKDLIMGNFIPIPTVLIRKSALDKVGLFLENYTFAEEYELFIRISKDYDVGFINEPLAGYRIHGGNLSKNTGESLKEDIAVKEDILKKYSADIKPVENKLKKELARIYYNLGRFYQKKRRRALAKEYLSKSIKTYVYSYKQYLYLEVL